LEKMDLFRDIPSLICPEINIFCSAAAHLFSFARYHVSSQITASLSFLYYFFSFLLGSYIGPNHFFVFRIVLFFRLTRFVYFLNRFTFFNCCGSCSSFFSARFARGEDSFYFSSRFPFFNPIVLVCDRLESSA